MSDVSTWIDRAKNLFPGEDVRPTVEQFKRPYLKVEFRYHDTSFDDMMKLSNEFGTTNINFETEDREGGYCETCRYSYTVNSIIVKDITK